MIQKASAGDTGSMSRYLPIERDDSTDSWSAVCHYCNLLVFALTDEAVARGPRRPSGSSQLLPVTMTARHECVQVTTDAVVEAAVNAHGRASNPKWDHPIFGYETFFEDQKTHLRAEARRDLTAATPHLIAMVATTIAAGMAGWGGEAERGYVEGFAEGAAELAAKP